MAEEAWVLAGGLGTRLRAAVANAPKILAPIDGRPFLDILLAQLYERGFRRVLLLTGYLSEQVELFLAQRARLLPSDLVVDVSREASPLGTAGALGLVRQRAKGTFFLMNGDTFFDFDPGAMLTVHHRVGALFTVGATSVEDGRRYGSLITDGNDRVTAFREKAHSDGRVLINAGVYVAEPALFAHIPSDQKLSLETEVLPRLLATSAPVAVAPHDTNFFDIGTPESYAAFAEFARKRFSL